MVAHVEARRWLVVVQTTTEWLLERPDRALRATLLIYRATARQNLGQLEGAIMDLQTAVAVDPSADILLDLARLLDRAERTAECVEALSKVIAKNPKSFPARNMRAHQYVKSKQLQKALEDRTYILQHIRPDVALSYLDRATVLHAMRSTANALTDCDCALKIAPTWSPALSLRASLLIDLGQYQLAIDQLDQMCSVDPCIRYKKAFALQRLKKFDAALDIYKSLESSVLASDALYNSGLIYLSLYECDRQANHLANAKARLERSRSLMREHGDVDVALQRVAELESKQDNTQKHKSVKNWSVQEVSAWMASLGTRFEPYKHSVVAHALSGEVLWGIASEEPSRAYTLLRDAGITNGVHQRVVLFAVKKMT